MRMMEDLKRGKVKGDKWPFLGNWKWRYAKKWRGTHIRSNSNLFLS